MEWEQQVARKENPLKAAAARVGILCITQIPGEYIINFITLLIISILLDLVNTY